MAEPYCGAGDVPKGAKRGTMRECAEKKQIRYYGIKKIDSKTLDISKQYTNIAESRDKLMMQASKLRGLISRTKGRYETTKDPIIASQYYDEWKKHEAELKKVIVKLKVADAAYQKQRLKKKLSRSKSKSKSKSKAAKTKSKSKAKKVKKTKSKTNSKTKAKKTKSKSKKSIHQRTPNPNSSKYTSQSDAILNKKIS